MAQRFLIDQISTSPSLGGASGFCIPYSIGTVNNDTPNVGTFTFIVPNNLTNDAALVESIYVNAIDANYNSIAPYLVSSSKGNITIHSKNDPDRYAIFPYYGTTFNSKGNTNLANIKFQVATGSVTGSSAYSRNTQFSPGEDLCLVLDYNDGSGGGSGEKRKSG